jgi:hypothetical protein
MSKRKGNIREHKAKSTKPDNRIPNILIRIINVNILYPY